MNPWRQTAKEQARIGRIISINGRRCLLCDQVGRHFLAELSDERRVGDQVAVLAGRVIGAAPMPAKTKTFQV